MSCQRSKLRRAGRGVSALAMTAVLGACAAVGPNFARPPAPQDPAYAMAGEQGPNAQHIAIGARVADDWWKAFHSRELDAVIRQALAGNPTLQATDATLAQLQAQLAEVRGQQLPRADLSATAERERLNFAALGFNAGALPGFSNNPTFPLYSVGPTVSYTLDVWGGVRRQVESASARAQAQARQVDAAYLSLTGQVATQAALIAAVRAEIATVNAILDADRRNIALVQSARRAGGVAEEARVNAAAQISTDNALLPPLAQQLSAARHDLALLVGRAPSDWSPPDFDIATLPLPAEIPVSLPSALVRERPDILQAEANLHAATADIGVETARLYPNINLTASLTQSALQPGSLFSWSSDAYTLGAGLTAPLFHGGALKARRQAAVAAAVASAASYRATVLRAFGQVADLLQALSNDEAALAAAGQSLGQAEASLRLNQSAYREGGQGLLPVVDSERQVNSARLTQTRIQAQRYLDTIQLFVATGHGWR